MVETEFLIPLDDSVQAAVACICALGSLGGEQAEERMKRLSDNADGRIRLYVSKCRLESPSGPLLARCRLAPMAENESWLKGMRDNLVDPEEACRFAFLEIAREHPAAELFAVIAGLLTDPSHLVRERAAKSLKVGATRDETQLQALFPALEYNRRPQTELSETEDLSIRTWALEAPPGH